MKILKISILLCSISLLSSCATNYRVSSDYDKGTDFYTFKTYNYLNHYHNFPKGANPINQQRIEQAIELELDNLGYEKTNDPDLLVSWFVIVETVKRTDHYYRNYYNRWYYSSYNEVYEYKVGTLVVDIIDRESNKVVWHGKTSDQVYEGMPDVDRKIKNAVNAIFKKYTKDRNRKKQRYAMN